MAIDLSTFPCPSCGGPLKHNPETQMIDCEYCGSAFTDEYFKELEEKENAKNGAAETEKAEEDAPKVDWTKEGVVREELLENQAGLFCQSCGAEVVCDGITLATECMYCGNPQIIKKNIDKVKRPDYVLPFYITKENAQKKLMDFYKGKLFLPKSFKDKNRVSKIAGMYVPFWLFSGKGDGGVSYAATKSHVYRSGDYRITETEHYRIYREGSVAFNKVPVDASSKMQDNFMDGLEPYSYDKLKPFAEQYTAGFFAENFDVDVQTCGERSEARMIRSTKDTFKSSVTGYDTVIQSSSNLEVKDIQVDYALLPVWMLNTKYKDKMYQFAINGETGRVSGELPIDKIKRNLFFFAVTVAAYFPVLLIVNFILK